MCVYTYIYIYMYILSLYSNYKNIALYYDLNFELIQVLTWANRLRTIKPKILSSLYSNYKNIELYYVLNFKLNQIPKWAAYTPYFQLKKNIIIGL